MVAMTYARNRAIGDFGEKVAAAHLAAEGMVILARKWICDVGEADLVARDGDTLVICEVKTRTSSRYGGPFEAITAHKATTLRRLAHRWMEMYGAQPAMVRIDVVSVVVPARGSPQVDRVRGVA